MKYVVFGSGGLAKELIAYLLEDGAEVCCVVSTEPFNNPEYARRFTVVQELPAGAYPGAQFLLAVADPRVKQAIVAKNEDRWGTYIHNTCTISAFAKIGKGCLFAPQSIVTGDAIVEDFVFFNTNATLGHDSVIGKWSTLFPNTEVCGDCNIGEECIFGIGAYVLPKVSLPAKTKVSAGAVVRKSISEAATLYGDPAAPRDYQK